MCQTYLWCAQFMCKMLRQHKTKIKNENENKINKRIAFFLFFFYDQFKIKEKKTEEHVLKDCGIDQVYTVKSGSFPMIDC